MRFALWIVATLFLIPCEAVHAAQNCYTVTSQAGLVLYRSTTPPGDGSKSLSAAVREKFPGSALEISAEASCSRSDLPLTASGKSASSAASLLDAPAFTALEDESGGTDAPGYVGGSHRTAGKDVPVRSYYRKDGTFVSAHTRAAPGRGKR